jgi:hypothetical protein
MLDADKMTDDDDTFLESVQKIQIGDDHEMINLDDDDVLSLDSADV